MTLCFSNFNYQYVIFERIQEELGRGQFGVVNKGMWLQTDSEEAMEVAVKSMEGGASEEDRVKFLQEAAIMGQFNNHPNILSIVGIILSNPVCNS